MTEEQYWDKDCTLVIYYRKAEKLRVERENQQAWLQGMYIYDTLLRLYPIFKPFVKKGANIQPYMENAYPLWEEEQAEVKKKKEKNNHDKAMQYMQMYMVKCNKSFEKGSE